MQSRETAIIFGVGPGVGWHWHGASAVSEACSSGKLRRCTPHFNLSMALRASPPRLLTPQEPH